MPAERQLATGIYGCTVMTAFGLMLLGLSGRSETVGGLACLAGAAYYRYRG